MIIIFLIIIFISYFSLSFILSLRKLNKYIHFATFTQCNVPAIPLITSIYRSFYSKFTTPPHYEDSAWLLIPLFIDSLPVFTMLLLKFIHNPKKSQSISVLLQHLISIRYKASYKNIQTLSSFKHFKTFLEVVERYSFIHISSFN